MGVHNLWQLLAPVGRRVSVETLAGKKLAIDASIWMIQFIKAMRNEKGEMVKNAHILGFFRRICKLLFLRTKPVFVFDGATPALKRRTVIGRRRQRENAQAKIRKTAENWLLNHLKTTRLQELAENLEKQRQKNDAKGKRKITVDTDVHTSGGTETVSGSYNHEKIDEMLAASLAEEDNASQMQNASTSAAGILYEEEDDEDDEEIILPTMHGKMDPAVLAALPPSMQLDLLVQMRERLMAENRQEYQKVKKVPEKFSELQIQAYLKTSSYRREIDEVRKSAAGRGIGGVQTSRIASEANREFIFSSSFTGDKQVLASAGLDPNSREQRQMPTAPSLNTSDGFVPTKKSSTSGSVADQSSNVIHDDVETYLDERGRIRVSRVRAMGLRMTRDLQRNLDLMKEVELESLDTAANTRNKTMLDESVAGVSEEFPCDIEPLESSDQVDDAIVAHYRNEEFVHTSGTPIEVSFDENGENKDDDDLFTRLVAGDSDSGFRSDKILVKKQCSSSDSDCEWEEGVIEDKNNTLHHEVEVYPSTTETHECHEINFEREEGLSDVHKSASSRLSNYKETDMKHDDESDVEWEDGSSDIPVHTISCQPICKEVLSKGAMEEEINFQEALKRSLEDSRCEKDIDAISEDERLSNGQEVDKEGIAFGSIHHVKHWVAPKVLTENVLQPTDSKVFGGAQRLNNVGKLDIPKTNDAPLFQSEPSTDVDSDNVALLIDRAGNSNQNIQPYLVQNGSGSSMHSAESERVRSVTPTEEKGVDLIETKVLQDSSQIDQVHSGNNCTRGISSHISDTVSHDVCSSLDNARQFDLITPLTEHLTDAGEFIESSIKVSINNNSLRNLAEGNNNDVVKDGDDFTENIVMMNSYKEQVEKTKADLEKEMQRLGKEQSTLGNEQRRLKRNAETVSSEMFAECQELLQMFGLPYIIAPMEAEAQCAFMELENLVDGVVTDDSDVLLFGARSVYKNIFDDRKYVETYFMKDIENELGLTRGKLIRMALLLGSDYTEGVSGIGIVNAIEVINAFPEEDGLRQFREWIESPDPAILGKVDLPGKSNLEKTASNLNCSAEGAVSAPHQDGPVADLLKMKQQFMNKHRKVSKNWHVPSTFPSEAVISAYDSPQVDKSTERFSWGKPDLFVLRKLCWEKFGWGTQKADELLVPVLKEYDKHETQLRLEAFYTFNERFAKIRSKRIKKAVKGTVGNKSSELMDDDNSKNRKRKKLSLTQAGSGEHVDVAGNETNSEEAATANPLRKRRILGEPCVPEMGNSESLMQAGGRHSTKRGSKFRGRGRGRGRSAKQGKWKESSAMENAEISSNDEKDIDSPQDELGHNYDGSHQVRLQAGGRQSTKRGSKFRGRGRSAKQGKWKESSAMESAEISSNDEKDIDSPQGELGQNYDGSHQVRRSTRPRKVVKYAMNDSSQDGGSSADEGEKELLENSGIGTTFAASASEPKPHELDPLLVENSSANIQLGDGVCQDEDELNICTDQVDLDQIGYTHSNAEEDYHRMGGGFCFEEDDIDKGTGKSAYSPTRNILHDNDNPSNNSVCMEDTGSDIMCDASQSVSNTRSVVDIQAGGHTDKPYGMPNQGIPDIPNTVDVNHADVALCNKVLEDDPGARSGRFLSAMPNLRRKRKI